LRVFERVLVCVDGSAAGLKASRLAVDLAGRLQSELTFLTVHRNRGTTSDADLDRLVPRGDEGLSVSHQLERSKEEAIAQGARAVNVVYREGPIVEAILAFLAEKPHDLVVVGTRGLSRGNRLLLGSVSNSLVNRAPCPVLVVRGSERKRSEPRRAGHGGGSPTPEATPRRAAPTTPQAPGGAGRVGP
jgi:nucleotide-binding universal stress UspA family protein